MSRSFTETLDQQQRLDALNVSYVCGTHIRGDVMMKCVTLVDNVSGEHFHRGMHPESHSKALDAALATVSAKPRTTAEIASEAIALADENARLRQLVEQLKSRDSEPAPAQEELAAAPAAPTRRRSSAT